MNFLCICRLPNAHKHDPEGKVVNKWLIIGLFLMASTLVLMAYVEQPDPMEVA